MGRKSVRIASLFSLFSFGIFLDSTKRIFPDSGVPYPLVSTVGFAIFAISGTRPVKTGKTSANARSILGFKCDEEIVGLGSNKDTAPYVYNFYFVVTGAIQNIDFKWQAGGTAYMNGKPCEKILSGTTSDPIPINPADVTRKKPGRKNESTPKRECHYECE